ncbi:tetratricopeptide repeat-containing sulfotransferase family protein [Aestuariivita sp.]|jgi:tetratricopeptide (TPR) repeat protein|uniref:tetratricopeptide repeat-containing sulfotransferase family protein n=1 Tax=Aestuariivita sp. TaxID=1872407 RepID=UPI002173B9BA|nr:tetratricopeptide repeat-containing sulfotransferase family protein [Aestuariivita sp.]MCE8009416.1 tetratricopeptide repeat protein [Aestuariivita sp.]
MTDLSTLNTALDLLNKGQFKRALQLSKSGMRTAPKDARFANLAGMALSQSGKPREGAQYFARALKSDPASPAYQDNLVTALVQSGQHDKAQDLIIRLLKKWPGRGTLCYQLAMLELQRARPDQALDAANQAINAEAAARDANVPNATQALSRAYNLRGVVHDALGDEDAACADYQQALDLNPDNVEALSNIALPLARRLQPDAAIAALEKALSLMPMHLNALHRYGLQLNELGRSDEAIRAFESVLNLSPYHAETLRLRASLASAEEVSALKPRLEAAYAKVKSKSLEHASIGFGLAHLAEKSGDHPEVQRRYKTANAHAAALRPYDLPRQRQVEERIERLFAAGAPTIQAAPTPGPRLMFVIGQPRSGTTLTERILAGHPDVVGLGEQAAVGRLAHPFLAEEVAFDTQAAHAFAVAYRASLPRIEPAAPALVDKMPANYKYAGFILSAFPDAVVIHTARDPRDVAWSMWRTWFPGAPMNYVFDQTAMAAEANAYARYMRLWSERFPARIHTIAYEEIVSDIDAASHRLAKICDLDWSAEMAAPERNAAPIRTASVTQARAPVHDRSVGGWRVYEEALGPFIDALDPDLWPDLD